MTRTRHTGPRSGRSQRGVVLVISLLLLLVLTLIGVAAVRSTTVDERMTANQRDEEVAFQAAEAALRDGESALQAATAGQFDNSNGLYDSSSTVSYTDPNVWDSSQTNSIAYAGTLDPQPASTPRYYIVKSAQSAAITGQSLSEDAANNSSTIYNVVARGVGLSGNAVVILQSSYAR